MSDKKYDSPESSRNIGDFENAVEEMKKDKARPEKINDCLSSLGPDQAYNINRLTGLAGELLSGAFALYSRIEDGVFSLAGQWQTPPGFKAKDAPAGYICRDVICSDNEDIFISDLPRTPYVDSDPNVCTYALQTCCGQVVKCTDKILGSLCVMYRSDYLPTDEDRRILRVIASAIASEEERKRAEKDLRTSRRQLTIAMDMAQLVHWEYDIETAMFIFDDHFYTLYSTTAEHEGGPLMSAPAYAERFCHPEDSWVVAAEIGRGIASTDPDYLGYLEHRIIRADGQERFIAVRYRIIKDEAGRTVRMYGANQDITARHKAEEALKESEERYRLISENMMDVVCLHDPDSRYVYVSPSSEMVLGYAPEEALGRSPYDFFEPEDRERILAPSHLKVTHDKVPDVTVSKVRKKNGTFIWLETKIKPVLAPDGSLRYVLTASRDVTERKQAEEALKLSEEKFRSIFENAVMGIFQTTPDGRVLSVNPTGARMHGYDSPEEAIESISDIGYQIYVDPSDRKRFEKIMENKDCIEGFETEHFRKDGQKIWVSMNAHAVRDASGVIRYYETTVEDITKRKCLETQLRQSQKMEAIGTLAGGIAHDFNNILMALIGYAAILRMKINDEVLHSYVDQILSASQKATDLVQSLLAFSRQQAISLRPVSIRDIITGTEKLLQRLVTEDITIRTLLADQDSRIMADRSQIDQILFNLATNARDAMPQGGTLTIEAKTAEIDDQFRRFHGYGEPGRYVLLSVSDTGVGMDPATRERIFDPFFTTKEVGKGTGLGLSTVYGIVKQHNGYVTVYSEPNAGTTFHIYLPAVSEGGREEEPAPAFVKGGTEAILIAEDNDPVRNLISRILRESGYRTIEAINGAEAVEQFKKTDHIDLLILDSVMPERNGREAYDEIQKLKPEVRVIFTSGYTRDVFQGKGIEDETFNFLHKPISPSALLWKVREVLDGF